jgi:nanoRNase/pAp phosphatase (c-di-AMP/oligoRNAs hydrolase)
MLGAQRILIISHKNPDADFIGANLALREAL